MGLDSIEPQLGKKKEANRSTSLRRRLLASSFNRRRPAEERSSGNSTRRRGTDSAKIRPLSFPSRVIPHFVGLGGFLGVLFGDCFGSIEMSSSELVFLWFVSISSGFALLPWFLWPLISGLCVADYWLDLPSRSFTVAFFSSGRENGGDYPSTPIFSTTLLSEMLVRLLFRSSSRDEAAARFC